MTRRFPPRGRSAQVARLLMACGSGALVAVALEVLGSWGAPARADGIPGLPLPTVTVAVPPIKVPPVAVPAVTVPPVTVPPISVPPVKLPPVTVPPISVPPVKLPPVTVPPIVAPPVSVPPITVPPISVPPISVPPISVPPISVPGVSAPPVSVPPISTPGVSVPPISAPGVSLPPITVPGVSLPPITVPGVSSPPVTVPGGPGVVRWPSCPDGPMVAGNSCVWTPRAPGLGSVGSGVTVFDESFWSDPRADRRGIRALPSGGRAYSVPGSGTGADSGAGLGAGTGTAPVTLDVEPRPALPARPTDGLAAFWAFALGGGSDRSADSGSAAALTSACAWPSPCGDTVCLISTERVSQPARGPPTRPG